MFNYVVLPFFIGHLDQIQYNIYKELRMYMTPAGNSARGQDPLILT